MRTDAIIIGSDLDGLVAATRLRERGHSIRMFSAGASSLHYAPEGVHVLGYLPSNIDARVISPLDGISSLGPNHPYRLIGAERVKDALLWFTNIAGAIHQRITINGRNELAISPAGLSVPVYGTASHQATVGSLNGKSVVIVRFRNYRDFPAELIAAGLGAIATQVQLVDVEAPGDIPESAALARAFDALEDSDPYFSTLKKTVAPEAEVILFPAVMGLSRNHEVMFRVEQVLGVPCLEVPTLPPSVPGMRLERSFDRHLRNGITAIHTGAGIGGSSLDEKDTIVVWDDMERRYEASVVIVSSGGVLMGGLDVDSYGTVHETSFGLDTYQSNPLNAGSVNQSLNALHAAGVETDSELRPQRHNNGPIPDVFVTGRTLAHWNPSAESSLEGVCIATGWTVAEGAHLYLENLRNG